MSKVIEYIKEHGTPKKPVSSYEISEVLGIGGFSIRKEVNKARCDGYPICSCNKGYYYSEDKKEIINTIQSLVNRTIGVERAVSGLLKKLNEIEREVK